MDLVTTVNKITSKFNDFRDDWKETAQEEILHNSTIYKNALRVGGLAAGMILAGSVQDANAQVQPDTTKQDTTQQVVRTQPRDFIPDLNLRLEHPTGEVENYRDIHLPDGSSSRTFDVMDSTRYSITFVDPAFLGEQRRKGRKVDLIVDERDGRSLVPRKGERAVVKNLEGMFLQTDDYNSIECRRDDRICFEEYGIAHGATEVGLTVNESTGELIFRTKEKPVIEIEKECPPQVLECPAPVIDQHITEEHTHYHETNIIEKEEGPRFGPMRWLAVGPLLAGTQGYSEIEGICGCDARQNFESLMGWGGFFGARSKDENMDLEANLELWMPNTDLEYEGLMFEDESGLAYIADASAIFAVAEAFGLGAMGEQARFYDGDFPSIVTKETALRGQLGALMKYVTAALTGGYYRMEQNSPLVEDFPEDGFDRDGILTVNDMITEGSRDFEGFSAGGRVNVSIPLGPLALDANASYQRLFGTGSEDNMTGERMTGYVMVSLGRDGFTPYARVSGRATGLEFEERDHDLADPFNIGNRQGSVSLGLKYNFDRR